MDCSARRRKESTYESLQTNSSYRTNNKLTIIQLLYCIRNCSKRVKYVILLFIFFCLWRWVQCKYPWYEKGSRITVFSFFFSYEVKCVYYMILLVSDIQELLSCLLHPCFLFLLSTPFREKRSEETDQKKSVLEAIFSSVLMCRSVRFSRHFRHTMQRYEWERVWQRVNWK
jgi:uncharacterized membrane protein